MAVSFEVGTKASFFFPTLSGKLFDRRGEVKTLLLHALLSSQLNMDKKVYRRISDNIYQTLQKHREASRELRRIQFRKGQTLFEKMQNSRKDQISFPRNAAQLNC
jgi:hypothetical protein